MKLIIIKDFLLIKFIFKNSNKNTLINLFPYFDDLKDFFKIQTSESFQKKIQKSTFTDKCHFYRILTDI